MEIDIKDGCFSDNVLNNISKKLNIDLPYVKKVVEYFQKYIQPEISKNYLSHLVTSMETLITEHIVNYLNDELKKSKDVESKLKNIIVGLRNKRLRLLPILLREFHDVNSGIKAKAKTIIIKEGGCIIFYQKDIDEIEKRIYIAHELGHIYIRFLEKAGICNSVGREELATLFAAVAILDKNNFYKVRCKNYTKISDDAVLNDICHILKPWC